MKKDLWRFAALIIDIIFLMVLYKIGGWPAMGVGFLFALFGFLDAGIRFVILE